MNERERFRGSGDITPPTFTQRLRELYDNLAPLVNDRSDKFWGGLIAAGIVTAVAGTWVSGSRLTVIVGSGLMWWGMAGLIGKHVRLRLR